MKARPASNDPILCAPSNDSGHCCVQGADGRVNSSFGEPKTGHCNWSCCACWSHAYVRICNTEPRGMRVDPTLAASTDHYWILLLAARAVVVANNCIFGRYLDFDPVASVAGNRPIWVYADVRVDDGSARTKNINAVPCTASNNRWSGAVWITDTGIRSFNPYASRCLVVSEFSGDPSALPAEEDAYLGKRV